MLDESHLRVCIKSVRVIAVWPVIGLRMEEAAFTYANIINEQSWTADKGDPPAWGLGKGVTISRRKKLTCYKMSHRASDRWYLVRMWEQGKFIQRFSGEI